MSGKQDKVSAYVGRHRWSSDGRLCFDKFLLNNHPHWCWRWKCRLTRSIWFGAKANFRRPWEKLLQQIKQEEEKEENRPQNERMQRPTVVLISSRAHARTHTHTHTQWATRNDEITTLSRVHLPFFFAIIQHPSRHRSWGDKKKWNLFLTRNI